MTVMSAALRDFEGPLGAFSHMVNTEVTSAGLFTAMLTGSTNTRAFHDTLLIGAYEVHRHLHECPRLSLKGVSAISAATAAQIDDIDVELADATQHEGGLIDVVATEPVEALDQQGATGLDATTANTLQERTESPGGRVARMVGRHTGINIDRAEV
jgi:hypothetical protein